MIGLDTNVLVRYLTQDDARQAALAGEAIERAIDAGQEVFVADIVLCELVWVLESAYGYSRRQVADALEAILRTRQFAFASQPILWQALAEYQTGQADFADYLIGALSAAAGCDQTLTFDKSLRSHSHFALLGP